MEHVNIQPGEIHSPHNWEFADSAARLASAQTEPALVGCVALQLSDHTTWRLSSVSPAVWVQINGAATGPQGPQGATGPAGANGTSVQLKGSVATVGNLPGGATAGDLYVVLADGKGYVWSGSAWNDVGPIQGPKGDTGDTGPAGAQGPQGGQGPQGLKGDTGDTGATGAQGIQGPKGDTGDTGATGAQGPQGLKGDTGDTGPAGSAASTDVVTEGTTNLYFTTGRVLGSLLAGLSTATNAVITTADSVLTALGKLQAQITGHVGNTSNPHSVTKAQVGLGNVDNTSDVNKPVSTAQAAALASKGANTFTGDQTLSNNYLIDAVAVGLKEFRSTQAISAGVLNLNINHAVSAVSLNANVTSIVLANNTATATLVPSHTIEFTADGTARTVVWPNGNGTSTLLFKWPGGTAPTLTSVNGKRDVIFLKPVSQFLWDAFVVGQNL